VGNGIRVTNCRLNGGTDLLNIRGGEGHLVENNFIGDASHTGLVLIMVQRSVVRGNRLTNRQWKMMEVFSTRDTAPPHRVSEYNLIENNIFDVTACSGIQYAGNRSILRNNIFSRCRTGMDWANYIGSAKTPEAWYNQGNRFYNNVLYNCGPTPATTEALAQSGIQPAEPVKGVEAAMQFATNIIPPANYGDNVCVNNIFFRNAANGGKTAASDQVSFDWDAGPPFGFLFSNSILGETPGQPVAYWCDASYAKPPPPESMTLKEWQDRFPKNAAGNIEVDPQFVAPDQGDFHLKPGSPCLAAGRCLTTAAADCSGTSLTVADASYFTDGYGIAGVEGDVIRVGEARAKIVKVDYKSNALTLDQAITCKAGDGVSLDYPGPAPDMGALGSK